jgi:gamma-glutamyltranspeptidase/glutathione hydrolase
MAVTANPNATEAALEILRLDGNALDAAIAAQAVLNLVEPQSSGVGGGGFLLYWDSGRRRLAAWDGRETAPASTGPDFARGQGGRILSFMDLVASGRSVGVPGLVPILEAAHRRDGRLRWERLFAPAIRLAENGFEVSPRLHRLLSDDPLLRGDASARALYYDAAGNALAVGTLLRNPALAATLRGIAASGSQSIGAGEGARRIAEVVQARGGGLAVTDLAGYRPVERRAVCGRFRQWRICGMPPPSSGGVTLLQVLGIYERVQRTAADPRDIDSLHYFAEAGRLAFADRARYLGDPDFVAVPQKPLLDPRYLDQRSRLVDPGRAMGIVPPGDLPSRGARSDGSAPELPATTHISIVDREGNAVALTSSIESAFGSRIMVDGYLLNNQLTDFAFDPGRETAPAANRAAPGKRPLSSMAPTMVFDSRGRLHAILGSPGGGRIIAYVARSLLGLLDAGMAPDDVLRLGHIANRNGATEVELGRFAVADMRELRGRGHDLREAEMTSGLHLIVRRNGQWLGAADPRREGRAAGD